MKTPLHELKVWEKFFDALETGDKQFEVRKNDRDFNVGDILHLRCWDEVREEYTGKELYKEITYILHGGQFGIEEGNVVMSIK